MEPTFDSSEYLIVDQLSYRFEEPKRGEVIIFKYPNDPSTFFIKRIIGLPGETLEMRDGKVFIKNEAPLEGFLLEEPYKKEETVDTLTTVLRENEYFVLGDNRKQSSDSRIWGALERKFIVGKAFIRLLPITKIEINPGDHSR
tara:strand:- start:17532 stop:17960 length:429 start_codon:yes stop_codon:yes gene_type:complete